METITIYKANGEAFQWLQNLVRWSVDDNVLTAVYKYSSTDKTGVQITTSLPFYIAEEGVELAS